MKTIEEIVAEGRAEQLNAMADKLATAEAEAARLRGLLGRLVERLERSYQDGSHYADNLRGGDGEDIAVMRAVDALLAESSPPAAPLKPSKEVVCCPRCAKPDERVRGCASRNDMQPCSRCGCGTTGRIISPPVR